MVTPVAPPAMKQPVVPPLGCRGRGLLSIPPAMARPGFTGVLTPKSMRMGHTHESHLMLVTKASRGSVSAAPFTIPSLPHPTTQHIVKSKSKQHELSLATTTSLASSSKVARKTAPPLYNLTRGSKKRALDVAACDEEMQLAMDRYVTDWRSAGDTSEDYWRSWVQLHEAHWEWVA